MTVKIFGSTCLSTRKARKWFELHDIPFIYRDIMIHPLSVKEIQHILRLTEQGTEDIISTRSKVYKQLNLNIESLSLLELYKCIGKYPRLLRHPIIFNERKLQIGFDEQNIRQFIPRDERQKFLLRLFSIKRDPQIEGV